jgi:nucleoside-diphosphate-sugar epimerase
MGRRLLITGASGFIGSFLCEKGVELGFEVWAGIRKSSSKKYLQDPKLNFIELTFEDKEKLKSQILAFNQEHGKFDIIIHNAGCTKAPRAEDYRNINFINTKNFVDILLETGNNPDKFIFTSSLAAFGPGKEKSTEPVMLNQTPNPINLYGKSKLEAEQYLRSIPELNCIIMRPTGVYGPREKDYFTVFNMINNRFEGYIGSDKQCLTFIYVKDLVRAYFLAIEADVKNTSYFLSESEWYYTSTFYALIKKSLDKKSMRITVPLWIVQIVASINDSIGKLTGKYPTLNNDKLGILKATNWICETAPLKKDLNFEPSYNLEKGVQETATWYKKEGWLK